MQKDAKKRDQLHKEHKVYAIEMEGSGVSDATHVEGNGYLFAKGICDYCDKTTADDWHNYAATVAAAYTRALIESMHVITTNLIIFYQIKAIKNCLICDKPHIRQFYFNNRQSCCSFGCFNDLDWVT